MQRFCSLGRVERVTDQELVPLPSRGCCASFVLSGSFNKCWRGSDCFEASLHFGESVVQC